MNLTNLIEYFREGGDTFNFFINNQLNSESEVIEIYMQKPFDFYYFLDFIEESNNEVNELKTNNELAKILFNYALDDA